MIVAMRTYRLLPVALSLSLLLSATGSLLQADCSRGDQNSHTPMGHHSAGMHSHISTHEQNLPCVPERDSTPKEPVPCSPHAASCCVFQAVPTAKMAIMLFESSRISLSELTLSHLRNTLSEVDFRTNLFRPIIAPQRSVCPPSSDRQAIFSTFLI